ncbi:MAG: acyltransferase, partial [Flavobacteriaceae bacterium]|nr:acyltransferase [Flavobacteriaceae bacterium]
MIQALFKFIYTRLLGWKLVGTFPKELKYIVAVVPHTSWRDFFIGILVRSISGESINFVGKKELFSPLTAWFFKGLGGAPIDRS